MAILGATVTSRRLWRRREAIKRTHATRLRRSTSLQVGSRGWSVCKSLARLGGRMMRRVLDTNHEYKSPLLTSDN